MAKFNIKGVCSRVNEAFIGRQASDETALTEQEIKAIEAMSPHDRLEEVIGWHLGDPSWAGAFVIWAQDCGMRVVQDPKEVLAQALNAKILDEACRLIQDALGIDTGDVAGVHFSGSDVDERWHLMPEDARRAALAEYLKVEMLYA